MPDPVLPPYIEPVVKKEDQIVRRPWLEFFNNLVNRIATIFTWGVWQAYTPVMDNSAGGFVLGNGSLSGRYAVTNKICNFFIIFQAGSTTNFGTVGGQLRITLPQILATNTIAIGPVFMFDSSAGISYVGVTDTVSSTQINMKPDNAGSDSVRTNVPFVWAQSDRIRISGMFEVA